MGVQEWVNEWVSDGDTQRWGTWGTEEGRNMLQRPREDGGVSWLVQHQDLAALCAQHQAADGIILQPNHQS